MAARRGSVACAPPRPRTGRFRLARSPKRPPAPNLTEPVEVIDTLTFDIAGLGRVRDAVARRAGEVGLDPMRRYDCVLAVSEIATNSVMHGGGSGTFRCWLADGHFVCEVSDHGTAEGLLVPRPHDPGRVGGHGLRIAYRLANIVQIHCAPARTTVRLHLAV